MEELVLKVAAGSKAKSVAGAIAGELRKLGRAKVRAMGQAAVYQAVLAQALARSYVEVPGVVVGSTVKFETVPGKDGDRTAILWDLEVRHAE